MTTCQFLRCGLIAGALAGATLLSACDRTIETKTKTVKGPDGTSVKTETTVQHPDGSITVDKESKSTTPK